MTRTAKALVDAAAVRLATFPNPRLDAELLFRGVSGFSRADLLTRDGEVLEAETAALFERAVGRREQHEPIQYILGTAAFWRDEFRVTPDVLIPRPETEILIEAVIARVRNIHAPRILDMGTGSGCIVLSLLRDLATASAVGVDLSEPALEVATANARRLGLESRVTFRRSQWFADLSADETFDLIVSNPPYVAVIDRPALPRDVRDFEPALALYADPGDDLSSYRVLCANLGTRLRAGGLAAFEVGAGQASRVAALLEAESVTEIEIVDDLAGIPRVVLGRRD